VEGKKTTLATPPLIKERGPLQLAIVPDALTKEEKYQEDQVGLA
jgi:hypothetical protein